MKKIFYLVSIAITLFMVVSCASNKTIPEGLTAPQLLQGGQTAFDNKEYKLAEQYYLTAIDQYGNNTETYIEARYELAHLYVKTKNYDKAVVILEEIIEIYDYSMAGEFPPSYKKLAQIEMSKIPENKRTSSKN